MSSPPLSGDCANAKSEFLQSDGHEMQDTETLSARARNRVCHERSSGVDETRECCVRTWETHHEVGGALSTSLDVRWWKTNEYALVAAYVDDLPSWTKV